MSISVSWPRFPFSAIVSAMSLASNAVGSYGERRAVEYLVNEAGMQVLDRNWRCPDGEIDIVARDVGVVVFIEVKTRRTYDFGIPAEAVGNLKRHRIRRLAAQWLAEHPGVTDEVRFDVISVTRPLRGKARIDHVRAAF